MKFLGFILNQIETIRASNHEIFYSHSKTFMRKTERPKWKIEEAYSYDTLLGPEVLASSPGTSSNP